jgi:MoxR-like ATPase
MPKITVITGDTGTGKSRLARKIAEETGAAVVDDWEPHPVYGDRDIVLVLSGHYTAGESFNLNQLNR